MEPAERLHMLEGHLREVVAVHNAEGRYQYLTASAERLYGYAVSELMDTPAAAYVHPDDQQQVQAAWAVAQAGAAAPALRYRFKHASGTYIWVATVARPALDEAGVQQGIVTSTQDARPLVWLEQMVQAAEKDTRAAIEARSRFLAYMSHDMRTPLTSVMGFTAVLLEEAPAAHREALEAVLRNSIRLLATVNSVHDLARLEARSIPLVREPLNLVEEIREAVELLQPLAEEKGLRLHFQAKQAEVIVRINQGCLNRILNNLIGNAIKFTDTGAVTVRITEKASRVCFDVADTGVGIEPALLAHVFDEFTRGTEGAGKDRAGSGLGLAITKQLVELMDGHISVTSTPGSGSVFSVCLSKGPQAELGRSKPSQKHAGDAIAPDAKPKP